MHCNGKLLLIYSIYQPTEMKWSSWQRGAQTTNCSWTQLRSRSLLWSSGKRNQPYIQRECVTECQTSVSWGVQIREHLNWGVNTGELVTKAQQKPYFLRVLRRNNISQLVYFYCCSIQSVLCYCLCVWSSSCTVAQRKTLQRIIKTAQEITGCSLPSLEELHSSHCPRKTRTF